MEDVKITIIGDSIVFDGYEVAKINKEIPSTVRGNFEEIVYYLQALSGDIRDVADDLENFLDKIRG